MITFWGEVVWVFFYSPTQHRQFFPLTIVLRDSDDFVGGVLALKRPLSVPFINQKRDHWSENERNAIGGPGNELSGL